MPAVLNSLGDESPSGENLEYEQVFTELEIASQPEPERQAGNEILPGAPPDPKRIVPAAEAVLAQSHDLRAAILLGYAELRLQGFEGLAAATAYIRGCLEDYWDTCHPQLDAEDDDDPSMRVNAVRALADNTMMLAAIRQAPVTQSPNFGRLSLHDIALAEGEVEPSAEDDSPPDAARVAAAFKDTPPEALQAIHAAMRAALEDVQAIDAVFDARTPGQGPDLGPVLKVLKKGVARLSAEIGEPEAGLAAEAGDVPTEGGGAAPARAAAPGTISSPGDVVRAIDRIIEYYERAEPSSPLPILLRRAQRLVGADFLAIVAEIAPDSTATIKALGGIVDEDAGY